MNPIDYLDTANLSAYFASKNRIANICNKIYIVTCKLHKTTSSIGLVKKAIHNNVILKFAQIKGQFVNRYEHIQVGRKPMLSHLNRNVSNLKIQISKGR